YLARVHDFGDSRQIVLAADVAQDLQAFFAEALEAVGTGPRFEGAAAQQVGAGLLDVAGDLVEDLGALDGARAGDHRHGAAADLQAANADDGVRLVKLAAGELERLHDRQDLLDAGNGLERLGVQLVLVADHADDRAVLPWLRCGLNPSSRMRSSTCCISASLVFGFKTMIMACGPW